MQTIRDLADEGKSALRGYQDIDPLAPRRLQVGNSPVAVGWCNQQEARRLLRSGLRQAQPPPAAPQAPQVPEPPVRAKALLNTKLAPVGRST